MEMGVSIDEVSIETIREGTKGLLGIGAKPYIVRLTTKPLNLSDEPEAEKKPKSKRAKRARTERPAAEQDAKKSVPAKKPSPSSLVDDPEDSPAAAPQRQKKGRHKARKQTEHFIPKDDTVYTPMSPAKPNARSGFLLGVLERMGIECGIGFADTPEALKFHIESDTMGILIGHRGETLDSLQYPEAWWSTASGGLPPRGTGHRELQEPAGGHPRPPGKKTRRPGAQHRQTRHPGTHESL